MVRGPVLALQTYFTAVTIWPSARLSHIKHIIFTLWHINETLRWCLMWRWIKIKQGHSVWILSSLRSWSDITSLLSSPSTLSVGGSARLESFNSGPPRLSSSLCCWFGSNEMLYEHHKGLRHHPQHTNVSLWLGVILVKSPSHKEYERSPFCLWWRKCKWVNIILPKYSCFSVQQESLWMQSSLLHFIYQFLLTWVKRPATTQSLALMNVLVFVFSHHT